MLSCRILCGKTNQVLLSHPCIYISVVTTWPLPTPVYTYLQWLLGHCPPLYIHTCSGYLATAHPCIYISVVATCPLPTTVYTQLQGLFGHCPPLYIHICSCYLATAHPYIYLSVVATWPLPTPVYTYLQWLLGHCPPLYILSYSGYLATAHPCIYIHTCRCSAYNRLRSTCELLFCAARSSSTFSKKTRMSRTLVVAGNNSNAYNPESNHAFKSDRLYNKGK